MQKSMVIKVAHRLLTAFLLLLVMGYIIYRCIVSQPPGDTLFLQQQVTPDVFLYVTKYNEGGATVSDVYRYYLDTRLQNNVLEHLQERVPFLVMDVGNAKVTGYGTHINVTAVGRVYSYTNSTIFYAKGLPVMPVISMNASGIRENF